MVKNFRNGYEQFCDVAHPSSFFFLRGLGGRQLGTHANNFRSTDARWLKSSQFPLRSWIPAPGKMTTSAALLVRRALVTVLLALAALYSVAPTLTRDM